MKQFITVVSGLTRSGTTMAMKMLHKGGMHVLGNHTGYEDNRAHEVKKDSAWLVEAQGKAIKILDLHRMILPYEFEYRIIYMKRDYKQQAKSQILFAQVIGGLPVKDKQWRDYMHQIPKDEKAGFKKLNDRRISYKIFHFEDVLRDPYGQAEEMAVFLELSELSSIEMGDAVIRRKPEFSGNINIELDNLRKESRQ